MWLSIFAYVLLLLNGTDSKYLSKVKRDPAHQIGCVQCHNVDENKINAHLVPHSHDDVGWLKTVDQYFYGLKTDIQQASVQYIITSVVEALLENSDRRYIQVETAFFWKWWKSQNDEMRDRFKSLVDNGQIEMVNGAWSMNDEACSNYQSTIDQFTWGLRIINDTIGTCGVPRVGWQIDPFGHSREQASIFAQLGYDGVFFARLDHDDKDLRQKNGTLDFAWQGSANIANSIIFGGIFPTSLYMPPNGYCWDYACTDEPVIDNIESPYYNVDKLVSTFKSIITEYATYMPTNNVFIPMGGDFQYEAAEMNFLNMDRFIKAFRDDEEINMIYSTPSCYIQAVNNAQPNLQLKVDDFFPYSNNEHSYWTGYFTSRPNSKRFERIGHNILQASKQMMALNRLQDSLYVNSSNSLQYLREIMGIMQHHDAITGTEKQHVANDYVRLLTRAIETAEQPLSEIITNLLKTKPSEKSNVNLQLSSCLLTNISICAISQNSEKFVVAVYNPLSWPVTHYIHLPVNNASFDIEGPDGKEEYDIVDTINYFTTNQNVTQSTHDLIFAARSVPPMGIKLYYVSKTIFTHEDLVTSNVASADNLSFGDDKTSFQIDDETNLLKSVTMNGVTVNITQNFYYYYSETGESDKTNISSGAYLFRPTNTTPETVVNVTKTAEIRGKLVDEFHQRWNDKKVDISQIIRVNKEENYIEFDWLVGGINVNIDEMGKEIITKYTVTSSFKNNGTFYTDSNGREMIKRKLNYRSDYTYNSTYEPVASNYYPVSSKMVIKDSDVEMAILTDRSQGGSSLKDGEIELMIHRRIIHDDDKGVGESLNETEFGNGIYVRGTHYLVIGSAEDLNPDGKTTAAQERILAQKKLTQAWIGIGDATSASMTYENIKEELNLNYSGLTKALPENINVLTFEPWGDETYLLRLEHILEKYEDPLLSNVTYVDISELFNSFPMGEITETTLGGNQWLDDYQARTKYEWNVSGEEMDVVSEEMDPSPLTISLTPMKIRTFIVKMKVNNLGLSIRPASFVFVFLILYLF